MPANVFPAQTGLRCASITRWIPGSRVFASSSFSAGKLLSRKLARLFQWAGSPKSYRETHTHR